MTRQRRSEPASERLPVIRTELNWNGTSSMAFSAIIVSIAREAHSSATMATVWHGNMKRNSKAAYPAYAVRWSTCSILSRTFSTGVKPGTKVLPKTMRSLTLLLPLPTSICWLLWDNYALRCLFRHLYALSSRSLILFLSFYPFDSLAPPFVQCLLEGKVARSAG